MSLGQTHLLILGEPSRQVGGNFNPPGDMIAGHSHFGELVLPQGHWC